MPSNSADNQQGAKKVYRATERERQFLRTGEASGSYRKSQCEEMVQAKINLLPKRIEALFSDIELLQGSGKLNNETWQTGWEELLGFGEKPTSADLDAGFTFHRPDGRIYPTSKPTDLGQRMGKMLNQLLLSPDGVDPDQVRRDIIWGFIRELYIDFRPHREAKGDRKVQLMADVTEMLERRTEEEIELDEEPVGGLTRRSEKWQSKKEEMKQHVFELLTDGVVTIPSSGIEEHLAPAGVTDDGSDSELDFSTVTLDERLFGEVAQGGATSTAGLNPSELATRVVECLVDSQVDGGTKGTAGQWATFIDTHDFEEVDVESMASVEQVKEVIGEYRLVERAQLDQLLREDTKDVRRDRWHDVRDESVFLTVFEKGSASSTDISYDLDVVENKGAVTRVGRYLAGTVEDREQGRLWTNRPLLKGEKDKWELTAYGEALANRLTKQDSFSTGEGVRAEVLTAALKELGG